MLRHALQRIALAIPVLFGVLLIGFLLMQVVPTDPATVRAGPQATAEIVAAIREGREPGTSAAEARKSVALIEAIYQSAANDGAKILL